MRSKNQRGVSEVRFIKKLDSFTLETSEDHLIRNFLRNRHVRVKISLEIDSFQKWPQFSLKMIINCQKILKFRHYLKFEFRSQNMSPLPKVSNNESASVCRISWSDSIISKFGIFVFLNSSSASRRLSDVWFLSDQT